MSFDNIPPEVLLAEDTYFQVSLSQRQKTLIRNFDYYRRAYRVNWGLSDDGLDFLLDLYLLYGLEIVHTFFGVLMSNRLCVTAINAKGDFLLRKEILSECWKYFERQQHLSG
jgi:hypothetical protein